MSTSGIRVRLAVDADRAGVLALAPRLAEGVAPWRDHERASRRGSGRALVSAVDAWARDHGLVNLTLPTGAFNADTRAFYAALGFTEEEVRLTRPVGGRLALDVTG